MIKYSEMFLSIQGEGANIGKLTAWFRFFGCNLQCNGFNQENIDDVSSYNLPYKKEYKIENINELPVFKYGCDSSYSWSAQYKYNQQQGTAKEIAHKIVDMLPNNSFYNKTTKQTIDLCFTGGEPMLYQHDIVKILHEISNLVGIMPNVTIETNGTQHPLNDLIKEENIFMSISPKLYYVSGERSDKAIVYNTLESLYESFPNGQLKYVMNTDDRAWDELDKITAELIRLKIKYPIYIMPVGADIKTIQKNSDAIINKCFDHGYHFTTRLQNYIWENIPGK